MALLILPRVGRRNAGNAVEAVGVDACRWQKHVLGQRPDRVFAEALHAAQLDAVWPAVVGGLERGDKQDLCWRAAAALAA